MSGHIFFADRYFGYDDAIYASCRLLEILSRSNRRIPELLGDLPKTWTTPEIRVDCPDEQKFEMVEKVRESFRREIPLVEVDGVRLLFPDGWGLVRASNTQPVLVLRFEARSEKRLREIRELVEKRVASFPKSLANHYHRRDRRERRERILDQKPRALGIGLFSFLELIFNIFSYPLRSLRALR